MAGVRRRGTPRRSGCMSGPMRCGVRAERPRRRDVQPGRPVAAARRGVARPGADREPVARGERHRSSTPARPGPRKLLGPARRACADADRHTRVRAPDHGAVRHRRPSSRELHADASPLRDRRRRRKARAFMSQARETPTRSSSSSPRPTIPTGRSCRCEATFLPGSLVPPRPRVRRRRTARQRGRPQCGRRSAPRGRLEPRLVASVDRGRGRARLRPELPPAELDRRRADGRRVVLLRLGSGAVGAAPRPPELPGRPARGDLQRARRGSRSHAG